MDRRKKYVNVSFTHSLFPLYFETPEVFIFCQFYTLIHKTQKHH